MKTPRPHDTPRDGIAAPGPPESGFAPASFEPLGNVRPPLAAATWNTATTRLFLCALLIVASPTAHALDFHLHSITVQEDGFTREQFYFQNDAQTAVQISLPAGWTRADDAASLTLTPPGAPSSMVKIEKSRFGPDVPFQDKGLELYRKRLLAELPPGATAVEMTGETSDPLPIFGWKSHEFTVSYELLGQSYRRSVLYLNVSAREQLAVTSVAMRAVFDAAHAAGLDVLRSWQVIPAP